MEIVQSKGLLYIEVIVTFAKESLIKDETNAPHISFRIVSFVIQNLWTHVKGSTYHGRHHVLFEIVDTFGKSKIC